MKKIILSMIVLLATSFSQAEVKPVGTFVPSECGTNSLEATPGAVFVDRVCLGKFSGMILEGLYLSTTDGREEIYILDDSEIRPGRGGDIVEKFVFSPRGEELGKVFLSNSIGKNHIHGSVEGMPSFSADLEMVFTTQSF